MPQLQILFDRSGGAWVEPYLARLCSSFVNRTAFSCSYQTAQQLYQQSVSASNDTKLIILTAQLAVAAAGLINSGQ